MSEQITHLQKNEACGPELIEGRAADLFDAPFQVVDIAVN